MSASLPLKCRFYFCQHLSLDHSKVIVVYCLPLKMFTSYEKEVIEVVCKVVCYMAVKLGRLKYQIGSCVTT